MAVELAGVVVGALIGTVSAISAVYLAHRFADKREQRSRRLEGLRQVSQEIERRSSLALNIAQFINRADVRNSEQSLAGVLFATPGWKECTLLLQERTWLFPCLAFLPDAVGDFSSVDREIGKLMNGDIQDSDVIRVKTALKAFELKLSARLKEEA
jgi:hypothetical protein